MNITTHFLKDDGTFPNNEFLPLIIYLGVFDQDNDANSIEKRFSKHSWGNSWHNGIFSYHHYHSTAHEVLAVYQGSVKVQFGGSKGIIADLQAGDAVVIPAGVVHKNLQSSSDFSCVGAYPPNQNYDMNYGKIGERPAADKNIRKVPLPVTDPIEGAIGALIQHWKH